MIFARILLIILFISIIIFITLRDHLKSKRLQKRHKNIYFYLCGDDIKIDFPKEKPEKEILNLCSTENLLLDFALSLSKLDPQNYRMYLRKSLEDIRSEEFITVVEYLAQELQNK